MKRTALFGVLLAAICSSATANETSFTIVGAPGDYVTEGRSFSYTPATATFYVYIDAPYKGVAIDITTGSHDFDGMWFANFASAGQTVLDQTQLLPGFYPNAVRYRSGPNGQNWLSVTSFNGCDAITGSFRVLLATYDNAGNVVSFWATFTQSCDGSPAATGEVKINVPDHVQAATIPTLGPVGILLLMLGLSIVGVLTLTGR